MTEIKRFVSYIYMYDNGIKGNNVGFAKVDSRNGQCKIAVNIKGLEPSNGKSEKVYLFYRRQEKILGIYIGSFQIINGIGEFHEQLQTKNIKGSNLSLDEMNGILVREEDKNMRVFASGWDDYAIIVNQFCVHNEETISLVSDSKDKVLLHASEMEEKRKEPIIYFDRTWKEESTAAEQPTKIEAITKEIAGAVETETQSIRDTTDKETILKTEEEAEDKYGRGIEKQKEDYERGVKRGQKMDVMQEDGETHTVSNSQKKEEDVQEEKGKESVSQLRKTEETGTGNLLQETEEERRNSEFMKQAEGVETVIIEGANGERSRKNIYSNENKIEVTIQQNTRDERIEDKAISEKGLLWGTHTPGVWKEISWEEYQAKEQELRKQAKKCVQQNLMGQGTCPLDQIESNGIQQEGNQSEEIQPNVQQEINRSVRVKIDSERQDVGLENRIPENQIKEREDLKNQVSEDIQNLEETMWDKLCHQFPKIRAFVDEPESICLKIDLRDLRMLPQENWGLGNNSFLLHGYYNFRYLILTQENGTFVLGIPGIYHPNEKVMASMFGFGGFKPVKICDKMLGQFGYWYKTVTL